MINERKHRQKREAYNLLNKETSPAPTEEDIIRWEGKTFDWSTIFKYFGHQNIITKDFFNFPSNIQNIK